MENTNFLYNIRWAKEQDWNRAMQMVWRTFLKFEGEDYSQEGIRNFYDFITDNNLYEAFLNGQYQVMVALDENRIIGLASVRNNNHLSLLFVDEEYHKKGVGRELIRHISEYLKGEAGECFMSLKSAPYAIEFYKKLGFRPIQFEKYSGISVMAMEKML